MDQQNAETTRNVREEEEQEEEEEEDDDPGMFSFLPPSLDKAKADPYGNGEVVVAVPPATADLTPPGTRHQFDSHPLNTTAAAVDSGMELSPAAAYAHSVALNGPRRRNAWTNPSTPGLETTKMQFDTPRPHVLSLEEADIGARHLKSSHDEDSVDWGATGPFEESISMQELGLPRPSTKAGARRDTGTTTSGTLPFSFGPLDEDEEDSPFPEVRASVSNVDDPEMPVLTFRAWTIGLLLSALGGGINLFFNFRYPAPILYPIVVQVVAHPLGKFLALVLPTRTWKMPDYLVNRGWDDNCSLNPGPWNIKEHSGGCDRGSLPHMELDAPADIAILLMANTAMSVGISLNYSVALRLVLQDGLGAGFDMILLLSTSLIGFGMAGVGRRFLVWPASQIWPQNLVFCTLLNTLHAEEFDEDEEGRPSITRFRFFMYVGGAAFIWCFFPAFIFQALSAFSFVCWAAPKNVVVNQLFGVFSGLGMSVITFDWSQIAYIGSPLIVPWWGAVNIALGFLVVYWIITPAMYYSNVWWTAYLPLMSSDIYDRFGQSFNTSLVITPDFKFDVAGWQSYSPLYLPMSYISTYGLCFALATAVLVHTVIYHGRTMWKQIKHTRIAEEEDVHAKLMRQYPETPDLWYGALLLSTLGLSIASIAAWHTELPVWALLVALGIAFLYIVPGGYIFAQTSQQITLNLIVELVAGYAMPNNIKGVMLFKIFALNSQSFALAFLQDLKLGHYMKIPPRITFSIQIVAMIVSCTVQFAITEFLVANVHDLCGDRQSALLSCPYVQTFTASGILWGLIGPAREFGIGAMYNPLLWTFLVGALLPIFFWRLERHFKNIKWLQYVNIPVFLTGATYVPPATGINYSAWFLVSWIFQYVLRRRRFQWWSKFNFVLSAALDAGTAASTIIIFLTLQLAKKGTISLDWWGNDVFKNTADYNGAPYLSPPTEGFGPTNW